ncbi:MAG: virulence RhuM family protein, partial [Muribaculaceae bacterium]|nr:virulence RhuM family protein [Muribaculaceae bacterium]MDE6754706.1 virulence RhuM family protein [Muribaculaceae bacterium]
MESNQANEIILYQPDDTLTLDVRVEDESVWLTQAQIVELFNSSKANISEHLKHIFETGELNREATVRKFRTVRKEGNRNVTRTLEFFNLDVIISVGYRVNTIRGIQFRQWANKVLKEYLLRGYSINQRLMQLEDRVDRRLFEHDRHLLQLDEKVDFFVRSSLQPKEGVFFNGQIFDAYALVADLIRKAKKRIVVIDNYIDDSVLVQLSKRRQGVTADIYDGQISKQLRLDVEKHNEQYPGVTLHKYTKAHDRFLIIDEEVYHIGASLKDLGKKLFAFSK